MYAYFSTWIDPDSERANIGSTFYVVRMIDITIINPRGAHQDHHNAIEQKVQCVT